MSRILRVGTILLREGVQISGKEAGMLTAYINAALQRTHYEILPDGEGSFGTIEGLQGVWAQADTLEAVVKNYEKSSQSGSLWGSK